MTNEKREAIIDCIVEVISSDLSYEDYVSEVDQNNFVTITFYGGGSWYDVEDEWEMTYTLDLNYLANYVDDAGNIIDEDAFSTYVLAEENVDSVDYEERGQEFYEAGEKAIEKKYGCSGAFLEPSIQGNQGATFLFADNMSFKGEFDYQTGEEYVRNNDLEGFIELVLQSFTPES